MSKATRQAAAALEKAVQDKRIRVEVFDMEAMAVLDHVFTQGGFVPKGHEEIMALRQMMVDLDVVDLHDQLKSGVIKRERLAQMMTSDVADIRVLESETVRFFLEKFSASDMTSSVAISMAPLIQRIKDAKMGAYKCPAGEPQDASVEPTAAADGSPTSEPPAEAAG